MNHPILYSFRRCPYAMRARMAIYLADIECELREVYLKNKPTYLLLGKYHESKMSKLFSIYGTKTIEYGFWRTGSVSCPPSS